MLHIRLQRMVTTFPFESVGQLRLEIPDLTVGFVKVCLSALTGASFTLEVLLKSRNLRIQTEKVRVQSVVFNSELGSGSLGVLQRLLQLCVFQLQFVIKLLEAADLFLQRFVVLLNLNLNDFDRFGQSFYF